jgi:hypothetical protein
MHPRAPEAVVEQLTFVAQNLLYPQGLPLAGQKILEVAGETTSFTCTDEGWAAEQEVVKQLLGKHHWAEKFSEKYLHGKLTDILHQVVSARSTDLIAEAFGRLVAEYEGFTQERTVIVPLAGLQMEMDELAIGNVLLKNVKGEAAAQLTERCRSILMQTKNTTEQKHAFFKNLDEHYLAKIRGRVCGEVRVVAEPRRAEEIALEEARRVIDLLRFSILLLDRDKDKKVIGLQGEACEDTRATVSIKAGDTGVNYMGSVVFHPFPLTRQTVEAMQEIGVFVLSDLLRKKGLTDFEEVILRAVHWLASAQAQFENENALLNLVTCLETFLKPAKDDPITATIAEGAAILTATGLEERKRRKNRVKAFYGMRSRLTHEGHGEILSSDLAELTGIARDLTVQMIRRKDEFLTQESLRNWIDDQKLTGPATVDLPQRSAEEPPPDSA